MKLVLIHGWNTDKKTWEKLTPRLQALGHEVFTPEISKTGSIAVRSKELLSQLRHWLQGSNAAIHLIGHSMGGLNARDIAQAATAKSHRLNIVSVATLGTPHWGSTIALLATGPYGLLKPLTQLALMNFNASENWETFTGADAALFNAATDNDDKVLYLSWAGRLDECVSVFSATWGYYLGSGRLGHSGLPNSNMVIQTLPILQDCEDGDPSSVLKKIKQLQAAEAQRPIEVFDMFQSILKVYGHAQVVSDGYRVLPA